MLQIKRMRVGQIGTNCYLLEDTDAKICAVVDPGDQQAHRAPRTRSATASAAEADASRRSARCRSR